ncbi:MAG: 50S ribosomal protein L24 [Marinilabiliales bacterium]|nr:MAG: 50S ribosomal protein L24 [Marinilabiliales bacterium]
MGRKYHIKKGDTVYVISGEAKGQQGRVLDVITKEGKAIVEGVNMVARHTKPNAKHTQGGIIRKEAPVNITNLMLVDPSTGNPTKVGRRVNDKNKLVRYSKKTGEEIK